ncbi:hypothetical protein ACSV5M_21755 [Cellvibrio sp. ARAG 10.3]|uniref:hypothetical protein n=1 Tax=Cellvibrio sp. ARAG 10.3 TaxID=3451358 RepID=UPI003F45A449
MRGKDSKTSTDKSLDELTQELIDRGIVKREQTTEYDFLELYHANPATLSVSSRRMQLLMHNSVEFKVLRQAHGLE